MDVTCLSNRDCKIVGVLFVTVTIYFQIKLLMRYYLIMYLNLTIFWSLTKLQSTYFYVDQKGVKSFAQNQYSKVFHYS